MNYQPEPVFRTKTGILLPGFGFENIVNMRRQVLSDYGITTAQIVEASSYSMAMVVRYALGLSSEGGEIVAIVDDCLAGYTVLATARHLVNSGARAHIFLGCDSKSQDLELQLKPLLKMGVPIQQLPSVIAEDTPVTQLIGTSHNLLLGIYKDGAPNNSRYNSLISNLNELQTPIHCVEAPFGIDPNTGAQSEPVLFASSTLSLGAPLAGLFAASELAGRHYMCDISISSALYSAEGFDLSPLFSEQPVLQIFANKEEVSE